MVKKLSYVVNRKIGGSRKARRKIEKTKDLNITSLIDILTILLVFLIQNVSFEVQKNSVPEGMDLPYSYANEEELLNNGQTLIVKIYNDRILYGLDNTTVGSLNQFISDEKTRTALLALMQAESKAILNQDKIPAVLLQADKTIECKYITAFMVLSATANFQNIYFSTLKTESRDKSLLN